MDSDFSYLMTECHNYKMLEGFHQLDNPAVNKMVNNIINSTIHHKKSNNSYEKVNVSSADMTICKDFITVKSIGKIELIPYEEIYCLKASSNYIEIHLQDRSVLHRDSLTNLEVQLASFNFLRVHRSSIINLKRIKQIKSSQGRYNAIVLANDLSVKLSGAYRHQLFKYLGVDETLP